MNIKFGEAKILKVSKFVEKNKIDKYISRITYDFLYMDLYMKMYKVLAESKPVFFDMIKSDIKTHDKECEYILYVEYRFKE